MNRMRVLARRVCAVVAAAGMAVSVGAVCAVADEEQVWREGGDNVVQVFAPPHVLLFLGVSSSCAVWLG